MTGYLIIHADSEALERVGREDGGDPHEGGQDEAQKEHHQAHPHHHLSSVTLLSQLLVLYVFNVSLSI